jgi:hypothetical protein
MGLKKQPKDMNPEELREYLTNFPQLFEGSFEYEGMAVDCGRAEDAQANGLEATEISPRVKPKKGKKNSAKRA